MILSGSQNLGEKQISARKSDFGGVALAALQLEATGEAQIDGHFVLKQQGGGAPSSTWSWTQNRKKRYGVWERNALTRCLGRGGGDGGGGGGGRVEGGRARGMSREGGNAFRFRSHTIGTPTFVRTTYHHRVRVQEEVFRRRPAVLLNNIHRRGLVPRWIFRPHHGESFRR